MAGVAFEKNYHQAGDDINNLDLNGWDQMADAGAHVLAMLSEDRNLRDTLAGGATANASSKKSLKSKARKAKQPPTAQARKVAALGAYLGDRAVQ